MPASYFSHPDLNILFFTYFEYYILDFYLWTTLFYHQFVMEEFQPLLSLIGSNQAFDSDGINDCIINTIIHITNDILKLILFIE